MWPARHAGTRPSDRMTVAALLVNTCAPLRHSRSSAAGSVFSVPDACGILHAAPQTGTVPNPAFVYGRRLSSAPRRENGALRLRPGHGTSAPLFSISRREPYMSA